MGYWGASHSFLKVLNTNPRTVSLAQEFHRKAKWLSFFGICLGFPIGFLTLLTLAVLTNEQPVLYWMQQNSSAIAFGVMTTLAFGGAFQLTINDLYRSLKRVVEVYNESP